MSKSDFKKCCLTQPLWTPFCSISSVLFLVLDLQPIFLLLKTLWEDCKMGLHPKQILQTQAETTFKHMDKIFVGCRFFRDRRFVCIAHCYVGFCATEGGQQIDNTLWELERKKHSWLRIWIWKDVANNAQWHDEIILGPVATWHLMLKKDVAYVGA